ncbi:Protein of unknown function [Cotesia congregata]|uniref:Uncharacterized protein n=1 Tax=Cotesia congregata TaxID=51543 RepID=A0A8J2HUG0_COTCN|nr:Protein of unknown function [Cotesia congregata]
MLQEIRKSLNTLEKIEFVDVDSDMLSSSDTLSSSSSILPFQTFINKCHLLISSDDTTAYRILGESRQFLILLQTDIEDHLNCQLRLSLLHKHQRVPKKHLDHTLIPILLIEFTRTICVSQLHEIIFQLIIRIIIVKVVIHSSLYIGIKVQSRSQNWDSFIQKTNFFFFTEEANIDEARPVRLFPFNRQLFSILQVS